VAPRRACRRIRLPVRASGGKLPVGWVSCGRAIGILETPLNGRALCRMTLSELALGRGGRFRAMTGMSPSRRGRRLLSRRQCPASRSNPRANAVRTALAGPCRATPPSPPACQSARPRDSITQSDPEFRCVTGSSGAAREPGVSRVRRRTLAAVRRRRNGTPLNNDVDIAPERAESGAPVNTRGSRTVNSRSHVGPGQAHQPLRPRICGDASHRTRCRRCG